MDWRKSSDCDSVYDKYKDRGCCGNGGIKVKVLIRVTSGNQFGINERQVYEIADRKEQES